MLKTDTLAMTAVLALLTALGPLSTDMYLPSLPAIARDLEATTAGTQMTLSAFLLGFAVGQFVYGPVSDRIGRKPVLLFGLGLFLVASLACTFAPTIEALIGARFVQALGASGPIVLGRAMVRDLYEGRGRGANCRAWARSWAGAGGAPVLGGLLHEAFGWRATFAAAIVFGAALDGAGARPPARNDPRAVAGPDRVRRHPARLPGAPRPRGLPGLRGAVRARLWRASSPSSRARPSCSRASTA